MPSEPVSDDYSKFTTNFKPPPPPSDNGQWELQFCRWWGWNWVQKTHMEKNTICDGNCPAPKIAQSENNNKQLEKRKVEKKHFKDLCQCLCFKKRPKDTPSANKIYGTPSNSRTFICETTTCGAVDQGDSIQKPEIQKKASKKKSQEAYEQSGIKHFSDSDSFTCDSCNYRLSSSTEGSVQYLKVVCNCKQGKRRGKSKTDEVTQTPTHKQCSALTKQAQTSKCPIRICGTQTVPRCDCKKKKAKHVTVVCCHCCKCSNNGDQKPQITASSDCFGQTTNGGNTIPVFQYSESRKFPNFKVTEKDVDQRKNDTDNWHESLGRYRPWDTIFTHEKLLPKFVPRSKHPWLHTTKSDILNERYQLKIGEEFASPISGKIYKLSPTKIEKFKNEFTESFPDPIKINKHLEYLQTLEQHIKTDLNSRAMLDSICDVILFNHQTDTKETYMDDFEDNFPLKKSIQTCSSELLQTYSFPNEKRRKNIGLLKEKSTQSITNHNLNNTRSFLSHGLPKYSCESHHQLAENVSASCDFNNFSDEEYLLFKENYKHNSNPFPQSSSVSKRGFKRSASGPYEGPIKKFKSMQSVETTDKILRNMENLFKKMKEIIYLDVPDADGIIQNCKQEIGENQNRKISRPSKLEIDERNEDYNNLKENNSYTVCQNSDYPSCAMNLDNHSQSSDSSLFSKIDEIINRSQATENQIQKVVLNLPSKNDESKRDYICSEFMKIMSPRNSDLSNGLATIMESSDEKSDENFHKEI